MPSKFDIKIIKSESKIGSSILEFKISGSDIDYIIVNTLRRIVLTSVPIYAFNKFDFKINTSIFNNNYLKLRIRNMPVWGIENNFIKIIKKKDNKQIDTEIPYDDDKEDDVDLSVDKTVDSSTLKQMMLYLNYKNKSKEIYTVTTSDAKFYFDQKQIKSPYPIPIPIVKLQPDQEIIFDTITELGIEEQDAIFSPVSVCYFKQNKDDDFNFIIESRGQINEKRILEVATQNIIDKISDVMKMLKEQEISNEKKEGTIIINGHEHTIGNLLSRGLQLHKDVETASYNMPHPLGNKVHINYRINKGKIEKILEDVADKYIELFDDIKDKINKKA